MKKILYFTAGWCGPCTVFKPIMTKLAQSGMPIEIVDIDSHYDKDTLLNKFKIKTIPVVVFLKDDVEYDRLRGVAPESEITRIYNRV
jgi:thioredoxin 1